MTSRLNKQLDSDRLVAAIVVIAIFVFGAGVYANYNASAQTELNAAEETNVEAGMFDAQGNSIPGDDEFSLTPIDPDSNHPH